MSKLSPSTPITTLKMTHVNWPSCSIWLVSNTTIIDLPWVKLTLSCQDACEGISARHMLDFLWKYLVESYKYGSSHVQVGHHDTTPMRLDHLLDWHPLYDNRHTPSAATLQRNLCYFVSELVWTDPYLVMHGWIGVETSDIIITGRRFFVLTSYLHDRAGHT